MQVVADTRTRLLTATNESFRRRGYHGTSMKHVTEAAQAPTGSLYHFFPGGKDELAAEVIITSGAAYRELFETVADAAPTMEAAVTEFFDAAAVVLEETGFIDPCPIGTVAREVASTNERLRQATAQVFASWIDAASTRLTAAGVGDDEAQRLATTFVAALEGAFVLARATRNADVLRETGQVMREDVEDALASHAHEVGELPR
jgi:AcrR family transcriptional regulator